MHGGDWNDGMNHVGIHGRGESVWLGWFLCATLRDFAPIATQRGGDARARRALAHARVMRCARALDRHAWDGAWYRRAYFDDGTPLGSAYGSECRIDSIAQSWATISGAANPARARQAMDAVSEYLVKRGDDLVLLFTPPFNVGRARPRLHQGLPARRARKRRAVHACRRVVRHRLRDAGRRRSRVRAVRDAESDQSRVDARRRASLQDRAVRRRRRRLQRAAARRPRRLVVVHRAPPDGCIAPASSTSSASACRRDACEVAPCIPHDWAGYTVRYRRGGATYVIRVDNPLRISTGDVDISVDGNARRGRPVRRRRRRPRASRRCRAARARERRSTEATPSARPRSRRHAGADGHSTRRAAHPRSSDVSASRSRAASDSIWRNRRPPRTP